MDVLGPVEFREGSLIYFSRENEVGQVYESSIGILYKKHTEHWYVFWCDDGASHHIHNGVDLAVCIDNFRIGLWKLLSF